MAGDVVSWDGTAYGPAASSVAAITCGTLVGRPTSLRGAASLELRPELAESYDVSRDGRTYTFRLRRGLRFSDGRPVTGADVEATFARLLDPGAAFEALGTDYYDAIEGVPAYKRGAAARIAGVAAQGDRVTFSLSHPDGGFLDALALPYACIVPADAPHRKTSLPPPTAAPYMVAAHAPGRSLTVERNPRWADNRAAGVPEEAGTDNVDGFDIALGVPPEAQALKIRNGEADFSLDGACCPGATAGEFAADPGLRNRFFSTPGLQLTYATLNVHVAPFDDPRVRQAVNYAVDREAVVKILGGPSQSAPLTGILPPAMLPAGDAAGPYPPTPDLDRARALLRDAGIITALDGGALYYAEGSPSADVAQQLAADLHRIRVEVRLTGVNPDIYEQVLRDPATRDAIALTTWRAESPDASSIFEPLLGSAAAGGGANYGDFRSPDLDERLAAIDGLLPGPERREDFAALARRLAEEQAPWIGLVAQNDVQLVSARYGGYAAGAAEPIALALAYVAR